jgi:transposase InsO family protein
VACRYWARRVDVSTAAVAADLGLSARTLRAWQADARHPSAPTARGRPPQPVGPAEDHMIRMAILLGESPRAVATLQHWCPAVSRRALAAWLRRYRRDQRRGACRLTWWHHGRVWAMDFSEPRRPIDGIYRYLLHVRDLASQYHLAALPVERATAATVCDLLRALVAAHDAPLVLKVDNGSAFGSGDLHAWADTVGTRVLYSPPRYPRYNGSIEASIGSIGTRTHHLAAAAGHPEYWTTDEIECARADANLTIPGGRAGATPAHCWQAAPPITATERQRFGAHCAAAIGRPRGRITRVQSRTAIVHTLRALGYVTMKRRTDLVHSLTNEKRQRLRA